MTLDPAIRSLRACLLACSFLLFSAAFGQVDNVYVYGTVKDYVSSKKLDGITVTVFKNGGKLTEVVTNASGKYEFNLDYGSDYKLVYSRAGMVSKNISIDTKNIPEEERVGGHGMNVEMTLFTELPGIDFTVLQQPIGKAKFDPTTKEVTWDLQYTEQVRAEIQRLMKEYDEKKKREANAEEDFIKMMAAGDAAMAAADYSKAVENFTAALGLKAGDAKATAKLSDAKMKLDELEGNKKEAEKYAGLIKEADGLFGKKEYANAMAKYQAASTVKEEEAYPKGKMKECQAFIDDLAKQAEADKKAKELEEKYKTALAAADVAFKADKLEDARTKYTDASGLKPDEKYPKDQIALIGQKLEEKAKKDADEKAKKELDAQYNAAILAGDGAFRSGKYDQAKTSYNEALGLKPEEKYPTDQLAAIDKKLEELAKQEEEERKAKELDAQYTALIAAADAAFKQDNFEVAKPKYNEALALKAKEKYPQDQLLAIEKRIAALAKMAEDDKLKAAQKELDDRYNAAIAKADAAFKQNSFDDAKAGYNEALGSKPKEKYPTDQLAAIERRIAELAKKAEDDKIKASQQELDDRYNAAVAKADAAFKQDSFDDAKAGYNEALGSKPKEKYPTDQLAAIERRIAELAKKAEDDAKKKELDDKYDEAITKADAAFQGQNWEDAKGGYNEALKLKAQEKYPKDQLAAIDKAIADVKKKAEDEERQKEIDANYQLLIGSADGLLAQDKLDLAKAKYQEALGVKPDQKYPHTKITEIDGLLAERARLAEGERKKKELDDKYDALIAKADNSFDGKKFAEALNDYKDALQLKPDEQHPKDRVAEINGQLDAAAKEKAEKERLARETADKEQRYNDLITSADRAFTAKDYPTARTAYTDALSMKPDEEHPKERLSDIERLLAELAAKSEADSLRLAQEAAERARLEEENRKKQESAVEIEARYRDAVTNGDIAFGGEKMDEARDRFTEALTIKPQEKYPKERLAAIEKFLVDRERSKLDADAAEAERLRLEEERRKKAEVDAEAARLAAMDDQARLDAEKAKEAAYLKVIAEADAAMGEETYDQARGLYTQAMDIKPDEVYPQAQIERIDKLLADLERKRRDAELAAQQKEEEPPPPERSGNTVSAKDVSDAEDFMRAARLREEQEKYDRIKKLKADASEEERSNTTEWAGRQEGTLRENKVYVEGSEEIYSGSDALRKRNEEELAAQREALAQRHSEMRLKADQNRGAATAENVAVATGIGERDRTLRDQQSERNTDSQEEKEAWSQTQMDAIAAGRSRSGQASAEVAQQHEGQAAVLAQGTARTADRIDRVAGEKDQYADRQRQLANRSEDARMAAKEQLGNLSTNEHRSFADYNRGELANQYPQGVTEESYTEGNKIIIRRIVVQGNKADEYKKVIAKVGTSYFKNGLSITGWVWARDTEE